MNEAFADAQDRFSERRKDGEEGRRCKTDAGEWQRDGGSSLDGKGFEGAVLGDL